MEREPEPVPEPEPAASTGAGAGQDWIGSTTLRDSVMRFRMAINHCNIKSRSLYYGCYMFSYSEFLIYTVFFKVKCNLLVFLFATKLGRSVTTGYYFNSCKIPVKCYILCDFLLVR